MKTTKTVSISGNLLKKPLKYILCPSEEFASGVWKVGISTISYTSAFTNIFVCCEISCNFVVAEKYNEDHEVETYEQPLVTIIMDTTKMKIRSHSLSTLNCNER